MPRSTTMTADALLISPSQQNGSCCWAAARTVITNTPIMAIQARFLPEFNPAIDPAFHINDVS
jgi:hypothetical protein